MYRNLSKASPARPKSILKATRKRPMELRYATTFGNLTSDENFHPISSSRYESPIQISKTRSYSRLATCNKREIPTTVHVQLSCFTLKYHTGLSKKRGKEKDIIFMGCRVHLANSNSNPSILKLSPNLRRATKLWKLIET
jgi:hypothetical protein